MWKIIINMLKATRREQDVYSANMKGLRYEGKYLPQDIFIAQQILSSNLSRR